MTEIDDETLSRFLAGDLDPATEDRVAAAVEDDPAVAARLEEMVALVEGLGALPLDALDDADVAAALDVPPPRERARFVTGALVAAVAVVVVWFGVWAPRPDPVVTVGFGHHAVDGTAALAVGDVRVRVDGKAAIAVEPKRALRRGQGAQEAPMAMRDGLMGAAVGALVTVAVSEGRAWIDAPGAAGQVVQAGDEASARTTLSPPDGVAASPQPVRVVHLPAGKDSDAGGEAPTAAALREENASLRDALRRAELEASVARSQLETVTGRPSDWPDDLPEAWTAEATRARLDALATDVPGLEVAELDCSEYPCIAVFQVPLAGDPEADRAVMDRIHEQGAPADDVGAMTMASKVEDDDGGAAGITMVTAWMPEGGSIADPVHVRTRSRLDMLGAAWAPEPPEGAVAGD